MTPEDQSSNYLILVSFCLNNRWCRDLELRIKVDFVIILYSCPTSSSRIPGSEYRTLPAIRSEGSFFWHIVYVAYREGFEKVASRLPDFGAEVI